MPPVCLWEGQRFRAISSFAKNTGATDVSKYYNARLRLPGT